VVTGVGATEAGLAILPVTASIAVTSTLVGRAVVRTGHYKIWPVIGSALFALSFFWLARMGDDPSRAYLWTGTALQGAGMGFGTPVFMMAMQNAVAHRDVGVVSSLAMFARNTGQAFGTAFAGSLLVARLTHHLDRLIDPGALGGLSVDDVRSDVDAVRSLDVPVELLVQDAFRFAVTDLFRIAGWVGVLSAIVALTIPQIRLRDTMDEPVA
jgi:MFS family permease